LDSVWKFYSEKGKITRKKWVLANRDKLSEYQKNRRKKNDRRVA